MEIKVYNTMKTHAYYAYGTAYSNPDNKGLVTFAREIWEFIIEGRIFASIIPNRICMVNTLCSAQNMIEDAVLYKTVHSPYNEKKSNKARFKQQLKILIVNVIDKGVESYGAVLGVDKGKRSESRSKKREVPDCRNGVFPELDARRKALVFYVNGGWQLFNNGVYAYPYQHSQGNRKNGDDNPGKPAKPSSAQHYPD